MADEATRDRVRALVRDVLSKTMPDSPGQQEILARSEIRILVEEWLKRIPRFSAVPGVAHAFRIGTVTALDSLPLRWPVGA